MSIPIAGSILRARDRFVSVLNDELAAVLAQAETDNTGYTLPAPEQIMTAPNDPLEAWRRLNVDAAALWVYRDGPSRYPQTYAGSPDEYNADQITRFRVAAIVAVPAAYTLPSRNGRKQLELEWLGDIAEIYRGALIDTLTDHLFNGTDINGIELVENAADVVEFDNVGPVARCSVGIDVLQGVQILGTHNNL